MPPQKPIRHKPTNAVVWRHIQSCLDCGWGRSDPVLSGAADPFAPETCPDCGSGRTAATVDKYPLDPPAWKGRVRPDGSQASFLDCPETPD